MRLSPVVLSAFIAIAIPVLPYPLITIRGDVGIVPRSMRIPNVLGRLIPSRSTASTRSLTPPAVARQPPQGPLFNPSIPMNPNAGSTGGSSKYHRILRKATAIDTSSLDDDDDEDIQTLGYNGEKGYTKFSAISASRRSRRTTEESDRESTSSFDTFGSFEEEQNVPAWPGTGRRN